MVKNKFYETVLYQLDQFHLFIPDAMLKMEQIYIELLNFPSLSSLVLQFYFYFRLLISCNATSPFHE